MIVSLILTNVTNYKDTVFEIIDSTHL